MSPSRLLAASWGRRGVNCRAPGMGHAVAAHLADYEPGQHATAPRTHDQQVTWGSRPCSPGPGKPRRAVGAAGPVGAGTSPRRARGATPDRPSVGSATASAAGGRGSRRRQRSGSRLVCFAVLGAINRKKD